VGSFSVVRRVLVVMIFVVGRRAEDVEVAVEVDIDLAAVVAATLRATRWSRLCGGLSQSLQASAHPKNSPMRAATASPSLSCSPASRWMPSTSLETMTSEASKNSHPCCSAKRS
jgi:hypothetical protein